MKIRSVHLTSIDLDELNCNRHPDRSIDAIVESMHRFGQQKPIVLKPNGNRYTVIAGNGRVEAARRLNWKKIAAVVTDLEGDALRAFAIADNQTARLSEWDDAKLAELIRALPSDLRMVLGFTDRQIEHIVAIQQHVEPEPSGGKLREIRIEGVRQEVKASLTGEINKRLGESGYSYTAIAY